MAQLAGFIVDDSAEWGTPGDGGFAGSVIDAGAAAALPLYTMRGYDTDLTKYVFWLSEEVDDDASDYSGNPLAVQDIVVHAVKGQ